MKIIKLLSLILGSLYLLGCTASKEISVNSRESWQAAKPKPFTQHVPERITIHHEGTIFEKSGDAPKHIKNVQTWGMGKDRNWTDIPYHFLIDPNGNVYEGRNVFTVGETATEYDPTGHLLITCMGNFEEQEIGEEQLEALINLTAYCCKKYQISPETIASHKDYSKQTVCPGKNLYKFIENGYIQSEVIKRLKDGD
ncbi:MAG: N-acetylmuramoyl-L-alanine amidase [Ignavibacteriaceae bacterium]|nr:N-acetylmuramoyl-L-alanine amidase [Ignavibacteriaceae bacterium]